MKYDSIWQKYDKIWCKNSLIMHLFDRKLLEYKVDEKSDFNKIRDGNG